MAGSCHNKGLALNIGAVRGSAKTGEKKMADQDNKLKVMSDIDLKLFLKRINVDVKAVDHAFRPIKNTLACVTCDYVLSRCFLCDQCIACCKASTRYL